jgi:hypothetical protein
MPSVNLQFHALFDELIDFLNAIRNRNCLGVELERFYPKSLREVPSSVELATEIKEFGHVDRFWLLYTPTTSKKAERFMLNVGQQKGKKLAQSQLGGGTNKIDAYGVLKQVASELRKRTSAGLWVVAETGDVDYAKGFRISPGAATAARAGEIDLVSIAFTQSFKVDRPETTTAGR